MDKRQVYERINGFIEAIISEYNPEKVVLYGSYAKGTNHIESDIDIAVIVDKVEGSFLDKEARLYKIRRDFDINIEPILLENNKDRSGFLEHILSYGEVLYCRGMGTDSVSHYHPRSTRVF